MPRTRLLRSAKDEQDRYGYHTVVLPGAFPLSSFRSLSVVLISLSFRSYFDCSVSVHHDTSDRPLPPSPRHLFCWGNSSLGGLVGTLEASSTICFLQVRPSSVKPRPPTFLPPISFIPFQMRSRRRPSRRGLSEIARSLDVSGVLFGGSVTSVGSRMLRKSPPCGPKLAIPCSQISIFFNLCHARAIAPITQRCTDALDPSHRLLDIATKLDQRLHQWRMSAMRSPRRRRRGWSHV